MTKANERWIGFTVWLVGVAVAVLLLAGCGEPSGDSPGEAAPGAAKFYELPDGRTVLCVWQKSGYAGGLSCDWDGAR